MRGLQGVDELLRSLHRSRDAAAHWEAVHSQLLVRVCSKKGVASPCLFYDEKTQVHVLVHGDDFVVVGRRSGLDKL